MASMAWYAAMLPPIVSRKNLTSSSDRVMPSCRPTALSSSGVGSFALATGVSLCLDVDDVLLVLVGVLLEVADGGGVGRRLLRIALEHLERAVLGLGDVDVEAAVVRLGIDGRLAGRAAEAQVALQRLDHLHAVDAVGLLHRGGPQMQPVIRLDGQRRDVFGGGAVLRQELLQKRLVRLGADLLVIALRADIALVLLGRRH